MVVPAPAPEVQQSVQVIVQALRHREDELVARMLDRFALEAPASGVASDPDMTAVMRESSYANLRAALTQLERGAPPLPAGPPADAIEEARTTATVGIPLAALLQTYRIGQSVAWDAMLDAVAELDGLDAAARIDVLRICTQFTFTYIDEIIPFLAEEYTRERDRLMRSR